MLNVLTPWIRNSAARRWFRPAMLLICLVGTAATFPGAAAESAGAAEKGVHFDPGSPAGTEYALPLSQARNEGAGKTGVGKDGSVEPAPLFGEGVEGASGSRGVEGTSGSKGGSSGASRTDSRTGEGGGEGPEAGRRGAATARSQAMIAVAGSHRYPLSSAVLLVTLVLLAGLALGLGLKGVGRLRST